MTLNQNFEFIKENIKIGFKEAFEYKANLFSSLFVAIIDTLITTFSLYMFSNLTSSFNLTIKEVLFFTLLKQIGIAFFWPLQKGSLRVFKSVILGNFNMYLTKPINIFIFYMFRGIKSRWSIIAFIYFIALTTLIFTFSLNILKYFLILTISVLIFGHLLISIIYFFESFGFFKINTQGNYIGGLNLTLASFPPTIFEQFSYKFFFFFFPLVLFGVSTLYYFNRISIEYFAITLLISLFLAIVFNVLTYYIWKIGMRRYEAFG